MPENNPMVNRNSGEISDQEALNILEGFMSTLTDNLGSLTSQIKSLVTTLTRQSELDRKVTDDLSKNIKTVDSNFKSIGKDFNTFGKSLEKINKDSDRTISELQRQKRNLSGSSRNIESLAIEKEIKIAEGRKKQLNALYEGVAAKRKELEHDKQLLENAKAAMESLGRQVELDGATNENLIKSLRRQTEIVENLDQKYNKSNESVQKSLDDMQSNIDRINKQTKELYEENEKAMAPLREVVAESQSAFRSLGSQSSIIAKFLNKEEGTEEERFQKVIDQTAEALEHAIDKINGRLNEIGDGNSKEREDLEEQRKILQEQLKATQKLSPALEKTAKLMGDLKGSLGKTIQNITKNLLSTVESKYLDAYLTGFQNVYQSIETTRNDISARLRMNQGDFSDLQSEIATLVEERNLSGSISPVDTNEALQQLVAAGVTNTELLKEFSIEQAKLKAAGSSINLTNEESLMRSMESINYAVAHDVEYSDAVQQEIASIERQFAAEVAAREQYGGLALANGGADQIRNLVMDIDTAFGKTQEEIEKDISTAFMNVASMQSIGITDPTVFLSDLQSLMTGSVTNMSPLYQAVWSVGGINPEEFQSMDMDTAFNKLLEMYKYIAESDPNKLPYVADVFGSNMQVGDLRRLNLSSGEVVTTLSDETLDNISKLQIESNEALANATYLSATASWMKEMENAATDEAIAAEKLYEGDKKYLAVVGGIYDGVKDIVDILTQYAFTGFSSGGFSVFGGNMGGTGTGGSNAYGDFMLGKSGTTAGALGKGAGVAVGVGIAGYSMYEHAKEADLFNDFSAENVGKFYEGYMTDSKTWTGMGTAVGSALGGPVAGAVMGALWGGASEIGNAIGDDLADWVDRNITHLDDGFADAAEELENAADALSKSAQNQYKKAQDNLNDYEKMYNNQNIAAMKHLLKENDILTDEELINAEDKKIQEIFYNSIIKKEQQDMVKSAESVKTGEFVKEHAQDLENIKMEVSADKTESQNISAFEAAYGGPKKSAELYESIRKSSEMSDDDLKLALSGLGVSDQFINYATPEQLRTKYESLQIAGISSAAGFDSRQKAIFSSAYSAYLDRQEMYDKANSSFKDRWSTVASIVGDKSNIDAILGEYENKYNVFPDILYDDNFNPVLDSNGVPELRHTHLYAQEGLMGKSPYAGKFASGITSVPFDSYPAYLHTGERVLTKEEARAYNELSANAVEQLSTMSDMSTYLSNVTGDTYEQVFNSENLGTDKLNKSIETQTTSLEKKLDIVINALNTLIVALRPAGRSVTQDANVMAMNSNITQLATAK